MREAMNAMSDLITQLADAIVAINNASSRLPTKAEIEEVLRLGMTFEQREALMPLPYKEPSPEFMSQVVLDLNMLGCAFIKHKPDGTLERATQEALAIFEQDAQDRTAWDRQERAAHKMLGYEGPTTQERLRAALEAREKEADKAAKPCRGSTDGKHAFSFDIINDEHRCPCGARARLP